MKCKINRNAAKEMKKMLENVEEGKMFRVCISHIHADHAHYELKIDTPTENDEVVKTDKDIDIILEKGQEFLDGVWIQLYHVPKEEWVITNPSKDVHGLGHHH